MICHRCGLETGVKDKQLHRDLGDCVAMLKNRVTGLLEAIRAHPLMMPVHVHAPQPILCPGCGGAGRLLEGGQTIPSGYRLGQSAAAHAAWVKKTRGKSSKAPPPPSPVVRNCAICQGTGVMKGPVFEVIVHLRDDRIADSPERRLMSESAIWPTPPKQESVGRRLLNRLRAKKKEPLGECEDDE